MKLIVNKATAHTLANTLGTPEFQMFTRELMNAFEPGAIKKADADILAKPVVIEDIVRKNWSIMTLGDEVIVEFNDEFALSYQQAIVQYYAVAARLVQPIKMLMGVMMGAMKDFRAISDKLSDTFDRLLTTKVTVEDKVVNNAMSY